MTNLIRAHFARLWRSPVFWLGTAATAAVLTCLCMLVHKRAVLAILLIFLVLGGVLAGSAVLDELTAYDGGWQLEYDPVKPAEGQEPILSAPVCPATYMSRPPSPRRR